MSTLDSGLTYDAKYQIIIEGGNENEKFNTSRSFPLSKYLVNAASLSIIIFHYPFTNIWIVIEPFLTANMLKSSPHSSLCILISI